MNTRFVKTENSARFLNAVRLMEQRRSLEAGFLIVDGAPGLGKTATLDWWTADTNGLFIRAKKQWTPGWMLREILAALGVEPEYGFEKMFFQIIAALAPLCGQARSQGKIFSLVIDEADHICRSEKLMDTLRDFSDIAGVTPVLVGMGKVRHYLTRFPQIASRVGQHVTFQPASLEDIQRLATELCEVEIAPDLVAYLHATSNGLYREAVEGLNSIEIFGNNNTGPVGCAEMAGEVLLYDRRTNKPVVVRG